MEQFPTRSHTALGGGPSRKVETLTDEITAAQRRALAIRDLGCVARGCTRPTALCDAHHLTHREHGGATDLNNRSPLTSGAT